MCSYQFRFVYNLRWCHWNNGGRPLAWGNQRLCKMNRAGAGARMAGLNLTNGWWSAPMTGSGGEGGNAHWEMAIVFTLWVCRVLVPGHKISGALLSWKQVFCFNLKNGLQEYQFVFFPKCIYVFLTFFGYIRILPAKINDTQPRKHQQNCGGTRVQVPGHQNSGAPTILSVFSCLCILIYAGWLIKPGYARNT